MSLDPTTQTIAAIATPKGIGALSIIRISGLKTLPAVKRIFKSNKEIDAFPRTLITGNILDPITHEVIDHSLVVFFPGPNSYTGEDTAEIHTHGGVFVTNQVFQAIISCGLRPAYPGEFTLRAFSNGKMDLTQAEAVLDVIHSKNRQFLKTAMKSLSGATGKRIKNIREQIISLLARIEVVIEYPDENIPDMPKQEMQQHIETILQELYNLINSYKSDKQLNKAMAIALVGRPNVGKSSLMNRLLGQDRSIIHDAPGTTRDLIGDWITISGQEVLVMDTAGITISREPVEQEGVRRTKDFTTNDADEIILILDASEPLNEDDVQIINYLKDTKKNHITALNKSDLENRIDKNRIIKAAGDFIEISALTGQGINTLLTALEQRIDQNKEFLSEVTITNQRHHEMLIKAQHALEEAVLNLKSVPVDILAIDLRDAATALGLITGENITENILDQIFSNFCVGK